MFFSHFTYTAGGSRANGTIEYATTSFDISANVESESFSTNVYDSVVEQTKVND